MKTYPTIVCPFFQWDKGDRWSCEWGILKGKAKAEYMNQYCAQLEGHKKCTLAKALYRLYEQEEEADGKKALHD